MMRISLKLFLDALPQNNYRKVFKMHGETIGPNSNKEILPFKLRVDIDKQVFNKGYSYDSPLLEKMKEEEELKTLKSYKQHNLSYSQNQSRLEMSPPIKKDLYSSNILVCLTFHLLKIHIYRIM